MSVGHEKKIWEQWVISITVQQKKLNRETDFAAGNWSTQRCPGHNMRTRSAHHSPTHQYYPFTFVFVSSLQNVRRNWPERSVSCKSKSFPLCNVSTKACACCRAGAWPHMNLSSPSRWLVPALVGLQWLYECVCFLHKAYYTRLMSRPTHARPRKPSITHWFIYHCCGWQLNITKGDTSSDSNWFSKILQTRPPSLTMWCA